MLHPTRPSMLFRETLKYSHVSLDFWIVPMYVKSFQFVLQMYSHKYDWKFTSYAKSGKHAHACVLCVQMCTNNHNIQTQTLMCDNYVWIISLTIKCAYVEFAFQIFKCCLRTPYTRISTNSQVNNWKCTYTIKRKTRFLRAQ